MPAAAASLSSPGPVRPLNGDRFWRRPDMLGLICLTVTLWCITVAWQAADVDALMTSWVKSEADAWIFGLTVAPLYFVLRGLAASWGVIVGIPTCLLAVHLALYRFPAKLRWLVAGPVTALIFIGTPFLLNHQEQQRLAAYYQRSESAAFPNIGGRAVELPRAWAPLKSSRPPWCSDECLDLLMFGRAKSLTLTFPAQDNSREAGTVSFTYRLGSSGRDCAGEVFVEMCAHFTGEPMPGDRLTLVTRPGASGSPETAGVVARRLYAKDSRRPGAAPAGLTMFLFPRYPGLLNIAWKDGGFHLPRTRTPILAAQELDDELYRAAAPDRSFRGKYYPFR